MTPLVLSILGVFVLLVPPPALAQDWIEFSSRQDYFFINFPHEPRVEEFIYVTEREAPLPARRYSAERGRGRYSVTVVDYTQAEEILTAMAEECPPDAHAGCSGSGPGGIGYWKIDVAGAVDFATFNILKRGSEVTYFAWNNIDSIPGRWIHLTNPDASRTYIGLYMHEGRLYILEGTVPRGYPEPGLFLLGVRFLDEEGRPIRYTGDWFYQVGYPKPPRGGGGQ